jgi:SAM-dependent methyltransferase
MPIAQARESYQALARFYDAFTSRSDYEAWTRHALALAESHGWSGTSILDVACGTGKSFVPFLARGFEVTACDISPAMLAEAARKAPGVPLLEADMRKLPKLGEFDLVVCFDDSLNHLLHAAELTEALASMRANLGAGGLLLFDLNTLLAYRTTFAGDAALVERDATFLLQGDSSPEAAPGCIATVTVTIFGDHDDGLFERSTARLTQRHFPPHRVTAAIAAAGLECVGVHGVVDDGSHTAEADETRQLKSMYVARLAKGGDPE